MAQVLAAVPRQQPNEFSSAEEVARFFWQQVIDHDVEQAMKVMPIVETYERVQVEHCVAELKQWKRDQCQIANSPHANLMIALRPVQQFEYLCSDLRLMEHIDRYRTQSAIYAEKEDEDAAILVKQLNEATAGPIAEQAVLAITKGKLEHDEQTIARRPNKTIPRHDAIGATEFRYYTLKSPEDDSIVLEMWMLKIDGKWFVKQWGSKLR